MRRWFSLLFFLGICFWAVASPFDGVPTQTRPGLGAWTPFLTQLSDLQRSINQTMAEGFLSLSVRFDLGVLAWTILVALVYGFVHALSPGHGKTLLLAYTLKSRAIEWNLVLAPFVGALLHVLSAVLLTSLFYALVQASFSPPKSTLTLLLMLFSSLILLANGLRDLYQMFRKSHPRREGWWWVALSIGLVPCPISTLIFSVALGHGAAVAGLFVCLVFGIGLGLSLTLVALLPALFGASLSRFLTSNPGKTVLRGLPLVSALAFLTLGLWGVGQVIGAVS